MLEAEAVQHFWNKNLAWSEACGSARTARYANIMLSLFPALFS